MRFGQAKRTQHLPLRQRREPLPFLRSVAKLHQNSVDRAVGDTDHGAGAAVASSDFFQHERQRQVVEPGTALLFRHANPVSAQRRQALVRLLGKKVFLVPSGGVGPELILGKGAHRVADHLLVLGQQHGLAFKAN
ncbi:hypothetical protein GALL_509070 [mine drainage metagenome]|uniref:Uncharacterized protein n=1 Tax=mine drainage metagenome TaxID=410659 RepID=A0A1J5P9U1_9ZZZZ